MTPVIVYDFDKTLTYRDTTLPLFCHGKTPAKKLLTAMSYYFMAVLVKLRLVEVAWLKESMLNLFFRNHNQATWEQHCSDFALSVRTNQLFKSTYWQDGTQCWVVSASFEEVLRPLFPATISIIGSRAAKKEGRWQLVQHAFAQDKARLLRERGIQSIARVYTDSMSDKYMMAMAHEIVWVAGDHCELYNRSEWEKTRGALPQELTP